MRREKPWPLELEIFPIGAYVVAAKYVKVVTPLHFAAVGGGEGLAIILGDRGEVLDIVLAGQTLEVVLLEDAEAGIVSGLGRRRHMPAIVVRQLPHPHLRLGDGLAGHDACNSAVGIPLCLAEPSELGNTACLSSGAWGWSVVYGSLSGASMGAAERVRLPLAFLPE